jgi:hypothetical protein
VILVEAGKLNVKLTNKVSKIGTKVVHYTTILCIVGLKASNRLKSLKIA